MAKTIAKEAILNEICKRKTFLFYGFQTQKIGLMTFSGETIQDACDELVSIGLISVVVEEEPEYSDDNEWYDDDDNEWYDDGDPYDLYDDGYVEYELGTARNVANLLDKSE